MLAPDDRLARLRFELRARLHYAKIALPPLRHLRLAEARRALWMALTGRDALEAPV
jgi:hypothetical protein